LKRIFPKDIQNWALQEIQGLFLCWKYHITTSWSYCAPLISILSLSFHLIPSFSLFCRLVQEVQLLTCVRISGAVVHGGAGYVDQDSSFFSLENVIEGRDRTLK
jgi:hypothetical protein